MICRSSSRFFRWGGSGFRDNRVIWSHGEAFERGRSKGFCSDISPMYSRIIRAGLSAPRDDLAIEVKDQRMSLEMEDLPSADKHYSSVQVNGSIIPFIRGARGFQQRKTEREMGVKIRIPRKKELLPTLNEGGTIKIVGNSVESVTRATHRIYAIIEKHAPKLNHTHFLSLPLGLHPELVEKLINFRKTILSKEKRLPKPLGSRESRKLLEERESRKLLGQSSKQLLLGSSNDVEEYKRHNEVAVRPQVEAENKLALADFEKLPLRIRRPYLPLTKYRLKPKRLAAELGVERFMFVRPKTFNFTFLKLRLWDKEQVDAAIAIMQDISSKVKDALSGRPVFVRLKGLNFYRGPKMKCHYISVPIVGDEITNDPLLRVCQVIINAYVKAGFVLQKDARKALQLYCLIMNARVNYNKRRRGERKVHSFDCRPILKSFGYEDWGTYKIEEVHLSQRYVFDESGYFHCRASIPLI